MATDIVNYSTQRPEEALLALYNGYVSALVNLADVTFQPLTLRNNNPELATCRANFLSGPHTGQVRLNWTRLDIAQFIPDAVIEINRFDFDAAASDGEKFELLANAISANLDVVFLAEDIDQANTILDVGAGTSIDLIVREDNILFYGSIVVNLYDGGGGVEIWNLNGFSEDGVIGPP